MTAPRRFALVRISAVQGVGGMSGQFDAAAAPKPAPGGVSLKRHPRGVGRPSGAAPPKSPQAVSR